MIKIFREGLWKKKQEEKDKDVPLRKWIKNPKVDQSQPDNRLEENITKTNATWDNDGELQENFLAQQKLREAIKNASDDAQELLN